ncbi:MAG: hypothetical protein CL910_19130 [Deltaproteobacteria bacterium]|jgi:DNA-binding NtrC family response regulator|nr:hypothetical protein [Deltaproteobacteria bacterium]
MAVEAQEAVATLLVVDDCEDALSVIADELVGPECRVLTATDGAEAWLVFQDEEPDLVVSDVRMPSTDGFDLLRRIRGVSSVPVVLLTAHAEIPAAVSAMRSGADDYLRFPDDLERLPDVVLELLGRRGIATADAADALLDGSSELVVEAQRRLRMFARLRSPVVIEGERGSGRCRAARVLHELSAPELPLQVTDGDDASIPTIRCEVVLRELDRFSARDQRMWHTELHRVRGGSSPVQRIFATCGGSQGSIPPRFWKELTSCVVALPALRDRLGDLGALAASLAQEAARELGCHPVRVSDDALDALASHSWPGNVTDLADVMEKAVALSGGGFLTRARVEESIGLMVAERNDGLVKRRLARYHAEREELVALLAECGGNVAEMSRRMGVTRGAVAYRLKKHGLST